VGRDRPDGSGTPRRTHRLHRVTPVELLLYLFGRQRAAEVDIVGPTEAVEALGRARFGV
jgi:hypothetical protein